MYASPSSRTPRALRRRQLQLIVAAQVRGEHRRAYFLYRGFFHLNTAREALP